ncbi:aminotransferase class I and II [Aquabacterium sp. A7-Y]|uniref:HipA family kinase n=1 Tax=Aquabacterium sp. A7-Y TaxID=1349605 RepID=UPI00223D87C8|nr:HipA family kinase [Aquabacterium sp. A7-Y]MCW7539491.1 aminotransferase class I and II [Aquabacterium sp. A7-Y]
MRSIQVTRYVTPLREGGSMPAVVEADDDGMYVLKFKGAGQGVKALVAELVAGEIARELGLPVPEIVIAELNTAIADTEPDPEIQELVRASGGINLALDYLPGAFAFDPVVHQVDAKLASRVVWFDALVSNLDRTRRNTNLLVWHRELHLIDHGAAMYFHHGSHPIVERAQDRFPLVAEHVLLPMAKALPEVDEEMAAKLSYSVINDVVAQVPEDWFAPSTGAESMGPSRDDYVEYFVKRLQAPRSFAEEAMQAHERLA